MWIQLVIYFDIKNVQLQKWIAQKISNNMIYENRLNLLFNFSSVTNVSILPIFVHYKYN